MTEAERIKRYRVRHREFIIARRKELREAKRAGVPPPPIRPNPLIKRVDWYCAECGEHRLYKPSYAKVRKYCSDQCKKGLTNKVSLTR